MVSALVEIGMARAVGPSQARDVVAFVAQDAQGIEPPTKLSVSLNVEYVIISDDAVGISALRRRLCSDLSELIRTYRISSFNPSIRGRSFAREQSYPARNNLVVGVGVGQIGSIFGQNLDNPTYSNLLCGCFPVREENQLLAKSGVRNPSPYSGIGAHIRSKLPLLLVGHHISLSPGVIGGKACRYCSRNYKAENGVLKPMLPFGFGIGAITCGAWLIMFTARRRGDWIMVPGAAMIVCGVCSIIFAHEIIRFAQNAPTFSQTGGVPRLGHLIDNRQSSFSI